MADRMKEYKRANRELRKIGQIGQIGQAVLVLFGHWIIS